MSASQRLSQRRLGVVKIYGWAPNHRLTHWNVEFFQYHFIFSMLHDILPVSGFWQDVSFFSVFFFSPWQIFVPVAILKKVPVAEQEYAWQYSKIAQNARASTKLLRIARGKFEKSARAPPKNARGKLWREVCHGHEKVPREKKETLFCCGYEDYPPGSKCKA